VTAFSTVNFVLASYMCLYFMLLFLFLFVFVFVFVFVFLLLFLFVFSISGCVSLYTGQEAWGDQLRVPSLARCSIAGPARSARMRAIYGFRNFNPFL
jgi:hypothetical protein